MGKGVQKKKLVAREVRRKTNMTKDKLEQALYTEDGSHLTQEEFEKLLSPLSSLKNQNAKLNEMGVKVEVKRNKKTEEKLKYYAQKDGSKRFDESKDGSLRVQKEARDLNSRIHGVVDVIDLMNHTGKK